MPSDMVVALGPATVGGTTLVGINRHGPARQRPLPRRFPARTCPPDETIPLPGCCLPQARQVSTVLGCQMPGAWGFTHGLNEHHVVIGCSGWQSKLDGDRGELTGPDLVRLALERSHSASHALETITDLIGRHGQSAGPSPDGNDTDHIFLIADGQEAFVIEAAGHYWAAQEVHQARAVADVALIRQDWSRLAPGLAELAIRKGLWEDGGSKLDFAGRLERLTAGEPFALKRWGRATLLLEQQNGHLDWEGMRRLLREHFDDVVLRRRPLQHQAAPQLHAGFVAQASARRDSVPLAWITLGASGGELFFPVFLEGELPALLERGPQSGILTRHLAWMSEGDARRWHDDLGRLQQRLDQDAEQTAAELAILKQQGSHEIARRHAASFMQVQADLLDDAPTARPQLASRVPQSDLAFVAE